MSGRQIGDSDGLPYISTGGVGRAMAGLPPLVMHEVRLKYEERWISLVSCWRRVTLLVGWPVPARVVSQGVGKAAGVQYLGKLSGSLTQSSNLGRQVDSNHGERVIRNDVWALEVRGCGPYMQQTEDGCEVREDRVHKRCERKTLGVDEFSYQSSRWQIDMRKIRAEERKARIFGNLSLDLA